MTDPPKIIKLKPIREIEKAPLRRKIKKSGQCEHLFDGVPRVNVDRVSVTCEVCGAYLEPAWVLYELMMHNDFLVQYFDELGVRIEANEAELKDLKRKIYQKRSFLKFKKKDQQQRLDL